MVVVHITLLQGLCVSSRAASTDACNRGRYTGLCARGLTFMYMSASLAGGLSY